ncbi:unnamed protein product [Cylindrotheca closterium]|uniref:Lipase maturation factor n=1 Tax=Cylindrotheca closterium TaxID=2856 RepID=A0AAD2CDI3_9STRA|nr:unnamed protein product [Cylindrotheca closterium]
MTKTEDDDPRSRSNNGGLEKKGSKAAIVASSDNKAKYSTSAGYDKDNDDDSILERYPPLSSSYHVSRWAILRLLGCMYFIAFLGAYFQNPGLMGSKGLQPTDAVFDSLKHDSKSSWEGFQEYPSIFWWIDHNDANMERVYLAGMTISALVVMFEQDSMLLQFLLWILYFSVVTTGQLGTSFYSYGWESQLLETGFLAIFLCDPWTAISPITSKNEAKSKRTQPSMIVLWLFRWLCFRISIGAGLIKIRGDSCWTQKTCLYYHFETQPIPSPLSFIFHFLPRYPYLHHAVDLDLFVQVYTSWMVLCPTLCDHRVNKDSAQGRKNDSSIYTMLSRLSLYVVRIGGFVQGGFMVNILLSGNFASLNHLTIIPSLACLDDACWSRFLQRRSGALEATVITMDGQGVSSIAKTLNTTVEESSKEPSKSRSEQSWFHGVLDQGAYIVLLLLIGYLSMPVVANLLQLGGQHQQMNASFGSFRLVNTYGAFGSVGKTRYEPIVSIAYSSTNSTGQQEYGWIELEFPCKPGNLARRPCFCAPYHYRLDWNIWFIGFKPHDRMLYQRESWLFSLISKLLDYDLGKDDRPWLDLLDSSTAYWLRSNYSQSNVPVYAKVDIYHYKMSQSLWQLVPALLVGEDVFWWNRTFEQSLIPPVILDPQSNRLARAA